MVNKVEYIKFFSHYFYFWGNLVGLHWQYFIYTSLFTENGSNNEKRKTYTKNKLFYNFHVICFNNY